jgi:hypothetical protein
MHRLQHCGAPNPSPTDDVDDDRKLELVSTVIQKWSKRTSPANTMCGPAFLIPHRRRAPAASVEGRATAAPTWARLLCPNSAPPLLLLLYCWWRRHQRQSSGGFSLSSTPPLLDSSAPCSFSSCIGGGGSSSSTGKGEAGPLRGRELTVSGMILGIRSLSEISFYGVADLEPIKTHPTI